MSAWVDSLDTNLREDLEALRRELRERRLVLVVGDALPGGDGGIRAAVEAEVRRIERTDLKEELEEKLARRLPLSIIADDLDAKLLHGRLQRAAPAPPDPTFAALAALGCPRVLSTRVDEGLPTVLNDGRSVITLEKQHSTAGLPGRDAWLFLVRGRASEAEPVALSRRGLEERDANPTWKEALGHVASLPMLLVGVELDDDAVLDRVLPRRRVQRGLDAPLDHWWLGCQPRPSARRRLGDVGARVIDLGDPARLLAALTWLAEGPEHERDPNRPPAPRNPRRASFAERPACYEAPPRLLRELGRVFHLLPRPRAFPRPLRCPPWFRR